MGSAQSKKRPIMPYFSDYNHLPSSPLNEKLLMEDSNPGWNFSEQYETMAKDILKKCTTNEKKVVELERKIEGLVLKNVIMEESIKQNTYTLARVADLEEKVDSLLSTTAVLVRNAKEAASAGKEITELEKKYEHIENLLLSKNAETQRSIRQLQAKTDGLALMSLQNGMEEVKLEQPEYVNQMMGAFIMLVFVVFVFIGMQL
ncbi:hypothetical protein ACHQM5_010591 [Ranunculus cassubicifolius]